MAGKLAERGVDVSMEATPRLLASKAVKVVSFAQWKEIDKLEIENGKKSGKIREKFTRVAEMLSSMGPSA